MNLYNNLNQTVYENDIYTLYFSLIYFKQSKKDKKDFGKKINKEFERITSINERYTEISKKLKSRKNNNAIFYLGLEDKINEKLIKTEEKIVKFFKNNYDDEYEIFQSKTYVEKNQKSKVLISITALKKIRIRNHYRYEFFMFPIEFIDHIK